jgi:hypothetical protein
MVGYSYTSTLERVYKYIEVYANGTYGRVRVSKDVIFDLNVNFRLPFNETCPQDSDFIRLSPPPGTPPVPPATTPQALSDPLVPLEPPLPPRPPEPDPDDDPTPVLHPELYPDVEHLDDMGNPLYWYQLADHDPVHMIAMIQTYHHLLAMPAFDKRVPRTFLKAMQDPTWRTAVSLEIGKFSKNNCFVTVPYEGQHLVPMMWLFTIKTDGTYKARLVGRGDLMLAGVDYDPNAVYCGNVSACSIKMCLAIAAKYKLTMRGGDLEGAYLVTRANVDFPVFIKTPQGYEDFVPEGHCIQAVGNLYGFPPAGQNFSKEFDKVIHECGYRSTPYDHKFFYKWIQGKPLLIIAHSDDFRWFGPAELLSEWDLLCATFNAHKYKVTDCTDKEFVGIKIQCDAELNYYADQSRMVEEITKEMNLTGARDEHLPYPTDGLSLSKLDNSTEDNKAECDRFPYRRVVGQLMYGMVHTMVCIMYALNVLSRYCNSPGPRHIAHLLHLLKYVKYARLDRLKFHTYDGPTDLASMTEQLQLRFQCDADLGGNIDNDHSQTSYLGYLGGDLICWCSTDQGSVSTSTAESEIKAVNHVLKSEVIPCRGIMNGMGWKQEPTVIEEDNSACVAASKVTHLTRNLRHLSLQESYFKEKVADRSCVLEKIESRHNNSDLGTKRIGLPLFISLTSQLVDRSLRKNLAKPK